jgi:hypothetical protein
MKPTIKLMQTQTATKSLRLSVGFDPSLSPHREECNVWLQLGILDITVKMHGLDRTAPNGYQLNHNL